MTDTDQGTITTTSMDLFTRADYDLAFADEAELMASQADRVLDWLRQMDLPGRYPITRLVHSLQSATRAERDGKDMEYVVCALLHDVGDIIGTANHSQVAAALIKPFVSAQNHWIVEHHGLFQGYYWFHHYGIDRDTRDRHKDHPSYQATVEFCAKYDQNCFDPDYPTLPLEHFEPMVRELFARAPHDVFAE